MKTEKNRESGLELLRIIAIILIVSHHLVVHCPFDLWAEPFCLKRLFFQFLYRASGKIGIALFLLITVWFLADKEISLRQAAKKIWSLWSILFFWNLSSLVLQFIIDPTSVIASTWLDLLFPLTRNEWWYVSSYSVFMLLLPFVRTSLQKMGKRPHLQLCILMIVLWGLLRFVPGANLGMGLNFVGFWYVFTLLAYYKWYSLRLSRFTLNVAGLLGLFAIVIWNAILSAVWVGDSDNLPIYLEPVQDEWSIPILAVSFALFGLFRGMHFHSKIVNHIASASFGVYLITEQPFIRKQLWFNWVNLSVFYNDKYAILLSVLSIFVVFCVATVLELVRKSLYRVAVDRLWTKLFDRVWPKKSSDGYWNVFAVL